MEEISIACQIRIAAVILFTTICGISTAQNPTSCASVGSRANSNGQTASCPNVSGTAMASNFTGTPYATVPVSSKTGNLQLNYSGASPTLTPYAISRVWLTSSGTTIQTVAFGPAGVPAVSGGNTQVNYCFYGSNLATIGTLSFELTDPQTGTVFGICSYDASCNTNCSLVANPPALPVIFSSFTAVAGQGTAAQLHWTTAQEQNNRGFTIERSTGGPEFSAIGFVPTKNTGGNSSLPTEYEFVDRNLPAESKIAWRLRQEDLDGEFEYSEIRSINLPDTREGVKVYAVGNAVEISWPPGNSFKPCDMRVCDAEGRIVLTKHIAQRPDLPVANLSGRGIYFISLTDSNGKRIATKSVYVN